MNFRKLLSCKLVIQTRKYIFIDIKRSWVGCNLIFKQDFHTTKLNTMAQRSITSFFKVTPPKPVDKNAGKPILEKQDTITSPVANGKEKRSSKRARLASSSSSEPETLQTEKSPKPASEKKKKSKRQRIESSGSESEHIKSEIATPKSSPKSESTSPKSTEKLSPKPSPKSGSTSPKSTEKLSAKSKLSEKSPISKLLTVKVEMTDSPKTYASPKSKKGKKQTKSANSNKEESPSPIKKRVKKEVLDNRSSAEDKENDHNKIETEDGDGSTEVVPVPELEFDPAKAKYHPIKDACWALGSPVPYLALARTFEAIEAISARLRIIEILSNLLRSVIALTPADLLPTLYLCLNQLAPAYHSLELGIAETYLMKAVGACTGRTLAQLRAGVQRSGDLGAVAESARAAQRTMFPQPALSVRRVCLALKDIANMTGQASVNKKIAKIQSLYIACRHCEARYLIRSLEGKLRIGLAEQSVLQALAMAAARTPPVTGDGHDRPQLDVAATMSQDKFKALVEEHALIIKTTYCECPNYDMLVPALLEHGVRALPTHCRLTVGVPLKPMLAHPTRGVHEVFNRFEGCEFTCEWKYDGERAQIHVPGVDAPDLRAATVYSRNQEDNTSKYPDVVGRLAGLLKPSVVNCVLDCEAVAYDTENKQILPFQILSTRKRKDAAQEDIKVQVCVFVFDLLYLNGTALCRRPLAERRASLREHFNEVPGQWQMATSRDCGDMDEVQAFLEEAVRGSCEGLMVKTLSGDHAHYDIARRSRNWLKLKKDYLEGAGDTVDVVVIGAYLGKGRRRAGFGGFLAACRDPDSDGYQALCKLGTGFSDSQLSEFTQRLREHEIAAPRSYYAFDASHAPDSWFEPALVWEVRCADLSLSPAHRAAIGLVDPDKGISLRFPRFVRERPDKSPEQATSARQVADMYLAQDQVRNSAATKTAHHADDFY